LSDRLDLIALADLFWRRKWVLLIPVVLCAAAAYIVGTPHVLKPVYQCTATLMLEYPQTLSGDLAKFVPTSSMSEQLSRLHNQIQGESFLKKVIVATGMDKDPTVREWAEANRSRYPDLTEDDLVDLRLMKLLRQSITMVSPRANVFHIQVQDGIPERARLIASTLTRAVIDANESARLDILRATHDFSLEQLALYKQKLGEAQERLEEERNRWANRQGRPRLVNARNRDQAWSLREDSDTERGTLDARYQADVDSLAAEEPRLQVILLTLQDAPWVLRGVEEQKAQERKYLELVLRPSAEGEDPQSVAIRQARNLESLRSRALDVLREGYTDLESTDWETLARILNLGVRRDIAAYRVEFLDNKLQEDRSRVASDPEYEMAIRRLEEEVETNLALYNAFVQQIAAAEISEAFESTKVGGRITVLEPPQRPLKPVRPNRRALFLLGLVIGVAGGLGGIFFLEQHDPSLRDIRQVEALTGLKVLGTLPAMKELNQIFRRSRNGRLVATERSKLRELFLGDHQAYHECRKVYLDLVRDSEHQVRSVLITSARAGEGKTTAAAFLAVTMARENPNARVVVVDLDSRRPALHRYFGYDAETPGVLQVMGNSKNVGEFLIPGWPQNLKILPLGSREGSQDSRLSAESIRELLDKLRTQADYVILDSPPNLPIPDALVAGGEVDAVVLVVRAGDTPRRLVRRGVELQAQFSENVRGIVVNNVSGALPFYESYRYYGYGS
jgi:capsular exopolysaccharide synthesis family protein